MKLQEVKAIAKQRGIDYGRMRKGELIKAIQRAEGNNDCSGNCTDDGMRPDELPVEKGLPAR